jgi:hypothetical protein
MYPSASVASRRTRDSGAFGAPQGGEPRIAALVRPTAWRVPAAVNDNKAPLLERLRRLVFLATAAAAVGWLFWVGVLR